MWRLFIPLLLLGLIFAGCGQQKEITEEQVDDILELMIEGKLPDMKTIPMTKMENGIKYVDLKAGEGQVAKSGDLVEVHYHVWLSNGRRIDSSIMDQIPFEFELGAGQVIKGWDNGIQGMPTGTKRLMWIPSELAYGTKGRGKVPPDAPLIFYVNLIEILQ